MLVLTKGLTRAQVLEALFIYALKYSGFTLPTFFLPKLRDQIHTDLDRIAKKFTDIGLTPEYRIQAYAFMHFKGIEMRVDLSKQVSFDPTEYDTLYGVGAAQTAISSILNTGSDMTPPVSPMMVNKPETALCPTPMTTMFAAKARDGRATPSTPYAAPFSPHARTATPQSMVSTDATSSTMSPQIGAAPSKSTGSGTMQSSDDNQDNDDMAHRPESPLFFVEMGDINTGELPPRRHATMPGL